MMCAANADINICLNQPRNGCSHLREDNSIACRHRFCVPYRLGR